MNIEHGIRRSARIARHQDISRRLARQRGVSYLPTAGPEHTPAPTIEPIDVGAGGNILRPATLAEMVGQDKLKPLLRRIIDVAKVSGDPLDHLLMVGPSGTGKTTTAQIVAHELGRRVFQISAPVSLETFEQLREIMHDGEVLIVDEIHLQVAGDRRGVTQSCDPETYFAIMEDHQLHTSTGVLPFPAITIIGCTTDSGLLPEPFLNRFPLQPTLEPYSNSDMARIVKANAEALGLDLDDGVSAILGNATRGIPRIANNYVRNVKVLTPGRFVGANVAVEVVELLNSCTLDGLTSRMVGMLKFLLTSKRENKQGDISYQASVNTIATVIGCARDTKAVALSVEPFLIQRGFVSVQHGGRTLTPAGVKRAREL